jgi:outer membrane protein
VRPGPVVLLVAVGLLLAPRPAAAQGSPALRFPEAVRLALEGHPAASAARAGVERAVATVGQARSALFPVLSADGTTTRFQEPMVVAPLHGFDPARPPAFERTLHQGQVGVAYTLFDGGARAGRVAVARAAETESRAARSAAEAEVIRAVAGSYLEVRTARELVAAHVARIAALERERQRAGRLVAEGRAPRVALLRAEAALSGAEADRIEWAARLEAAGRQLGRLVGWPAAAIEEAALDPLAVMDLAPLEEWIAAAESAGPEVERASARLAGASAGVRETRALYLPRLHATGRYVEYGSGGGAFEGEWQAGLQLSYPLFTGGMRRSAVARSRAEEREAAAALALARFRAAERVDAAHGRAVAAQARATALAAAVAQLEEVSRIERLALETGAGMQTDYLTAEAELVRGRAAWVEARTGVVLAALDLARAAGMLTADWLLTGVEVVR